MFDYDEVEYYLDEDYSEWETEQVFQDLRTEVNDLAFPEDEWEEEYADDYDDFLAYESFLSNPGLDGPYD